MIHSVEKKPSSMPYQGTRRKPTSPAIIWIATRFFIGERTVARFAGASEARSERSERRTGARASPERDPGSSTGTLERRAIPTGGSCAGFVRRLEEVHQGRAGRGGSSDLVVGQDELRELGVVEL